MKKKLFFALAMVMIMGMGDVFASNNDSQGQQDNTELTAKKKKRKKSKKRKGGKRKGSSSDMSLGIAVDGGLTIATGTITESYVLGGQYGIHPQLYIMEDKLSLGLGFTGHSLIGSSSTLDVSEDGSSASLSSGKVRNIFVSGRFNLMTDRVFRPYVGLNIGLYMLNVVATNSIGETDSFMGVTFGAEETTYTPVKGTTFGFAPHVGFWVGRAFSFGFDLGYDWSTSVKYDYTYEKFKEGGGYDVIKESGKIGMGGITIKIGLMYKFGL